MTALPIRENYPGSISVAAMPRGKPGLFGSRRPVRPAAHDGTMAHRGMPALAMSEGEQEPMQEGQSMPARGLGNHWSVGSDGSTLGANIERAPQQAMQQGGPLGGSMRQPFDYDAAMKAMVGDYKKPKDWQVALAILSDVSEQARRVRFFRVAYRLEQHRREGDYPLRANTDQSDEVCNRALYCGSLAWRMASGFPGRWRASGYGACPCDARFGLGCGDV